MIRNGLSQENEKIEFPLKIKGDQYFVKKNVFFKNNDFPFNSPNLYLLFEYSESLPKSLLLFKLENLDLKPSVEIYFNRDEILKSRFISITLPGTGFNFTTQPICEENSLIKLNIALIQENGFFWVLVKINEKVFKSEKVFISGIGFSNMKVLREENTFEGELRISQFNFIKNISGLVFSIYKTEKECHNNCEFFSEFSIKENQCLECMTGFVLNRENGKCEAFCEFGKKNVNNRCLNCVDPECSELKKKYFKFEKKTPNFYVVKKLENSPDLNFKDMFIFKVDVEDLIPDKDYYLNISSEKDQIYYKFIFDKKFQDNNLKITFQMKKSEPFYDFNKNQIPYQNVVFERFGKNDPLSESFTEEKNYFKNVSTFFSPQKILYEKNSENLREINNHSSLEEFDKVNSRIIINSKPFHQLFSRELDSKVIQPFEIYLGTNSDSENLSSSISTIKRYIEKENIKNDKKEIDKTSIINQTKNNNDEINNTNQKKNINVKISNVIEKMSQNKEMQIFNNDSQNKNYLLKRIPEIKNSNLNFNSETFSINSKFIMTNYVVSNLIEINKVLGNINYYLFLISCAIGVIGSLNFVKGFFFQKFIQTILIFQFFSFFSIYKIELSILFYSYFSVITDKFLGKQKIIFFNNLIQNQKLEFFNQEIDFANNNISKTLIKSNFVENFGNTIIIHAAVVLFFLIILLILKILNNQDKEKYKNPTLLNFYKFLSYIKKHLIIKVMQSLLMIFIIEIIIFSIYNFINKNDVNLFFKFSFFLSIFYFIVIVLLVINSLCHLRKSSTNSYIEFEKIHNKIKNDSDEELNKQYKANELLKNKLKKNKEESEIDIASEEGKKLQKKLQNEENERIKEKTILKEYFFIYEGLNYKGKKRFFQFFSISGLFNICINICKFPSKTLNTSFCYFINFCDFFYLHCFSKAGKGKILEIRTNCQSFGYSHHFNVIFAPNNWD